MYHNIESYVCGMVCGVDFVVLADAKSQAKVKNMLEILNASNKKVVLNRNTGDGSGLGLCRKLSCDTQIETNLQ